MPVTTTYVWEIESSTEPNGGIRISLVRSRVIRRSAFFLQRVEIVERLVFFSRTFRSLLDTVAQTDYRAQLELVASYARDEQFGCFVFTRSEGPRVEVILYERTFDDTRVRTEELSRRAFDASDERSLVASAEFVADLQMWAERRNDERDTAIKDEREADVVRMQVAFEHEGAGRELREILAAHAHADLTTD